MEQRQASLCGVKFTRGAKGEVRWEVETSAMASLQAVHDAMRMDAWLREVYYPDDKRKLDTYLTGGIPNPGADLAKLHSFLEENFPHSELLEVGTVQTAIDIMTHQSHEISNAWDRLEKEIEVELPVEEPGEEAPEEQGQ